MKTQLVKFKSTVLYLLLLLPTLGLKGEEKHLNLNQAKVDTATFAAGCFWCVEEQFKSLRGVQKVTPGYTGGHTKNPSYGQVITGKTGHAEACQILFDPSVISYSELLKAFFIAHDPSQLNRQGNDIGTQYRSAIFYHSVRQKQLAEFFIERLNKQKVYKNEIVTTVSKQSKFYLAESYHRDYYAKNPDDPYCRLVIKPKMDRFKKVFSEKLKP